MTDGVSLLPVLNLSATLAAPVRHELWLHDDVLRVGDYKLITGGGTASTLCMLGLGGDPVGLPRDPANLTNMCGGSTCTGRETGQDLLICSGCRCPGYNAFYDPLLMCTPCVFNVRSDPGERLNLANSAGDPRAVWGWYLVSM